MVGWIFLFLVGRNILVKSAVVPWLMHFLWCKFVMALFVTGIRAVSSRACVHGAISLPAPPLLGCEASGQAGHQSSQHPCPQWRESCVRQGHFCMQAVLGSLDEPARASPVTPLSPFCLWIAWWKRQQGFLSGWMWHKGLL